MKCEKCKNDMVVDHTRILLSNPPKHIYFCPVCDTDGINGPHKWSITTQVFMEVNWDLVKSIEDIKAILKCLDIKFSESIVPKESRHLFK